MIPEYPKTSDIKLQHRDILDKRLKALPEGISEFTFANLYLFRKTHDYKISRLPENNILITGMEKKRPFFMLPFNLPQDPLLEELFEKFNTLKNIAEKQARILENKGYDINEDRHNFDYLYSRKQMAELSGRKFHKKRNRVNIFIENNEYSAQPLLPEFENDALEVLEKWHKKMSSEADYKPAKEALRNMDYLALCGCIYYVNEKPVGYSLGEELANGKSFAIHFEKALETKKFKGIYQFINQSFASILPDKYEFINMEQDLGISGLRKAKKSYHPIGFVKKFRAVKP